MGKSDLALWGENSITSQVGTDIESDAGSYHSNSAFLPVMFLPQPHHCGAALSPKQQFLIKLLLLVLHTNALIESWLGNLATRNLSILKDLLTRTIANLCTYFSS